MELDDAGARGRLRPDERSCAVSHLVEHVERLHRASGDRFPVARAVGEDWLLSRRGSWSAGCWAASLWLSARVRDDRRASAARACTEWLARSADEDTSARATIFWLGSAAAPPLMDVRVWERARDVTARVVGTFDAARGIVPDGAALGRGAAGLHEAMIDAGFAVSRLLHRMDGAVPGAGAVAQRHVETLLSGVTDGGRAHVTCGGGPPAGPCGNAGVWARGQAWALLAAVAAGWDAPGDGALDHARALARHFAALPVPAPDLLEAVPQGAQPVRPSIVDTGATAIAAYALLGLAEQDPVDGERHRALAENLLAVLVRAHLTDPRAGLLHGSYRLTGLHAQEVESVWGNFFLLAALLVTDAGLPADTF
ncbi:MAG: glucuronyl hydrolase [Pseudonocardia sp.]